MSPRATRFIVVLDEPSKADNDHIHEMLKTPTVGVGWWHWFQTVWLIADPSGRSIGTWRKALEAVVSCQFLIFEAGGQGWNGKAVPKVYEWMSEHWFPPAS